MQVDCSLGQFVSFTMLTEFRALLFNFQQNDFCNYSFFNTVKFIFFQN